MVSFVSFEFWSTFKVRISVFWGFEQLSLFWRKAKSEKGASKDICYFRYLNSYSRKRTIKRTKVSRTRDSSRSEFYVKIQRIRRTIPLVYSCSSHFHQRYETRRTYWYAEKPSGAFRWVFILESQIIFWHYTYLKIFCISITSH